MKTHTEEILRWAAIVGCGGCGAWLLFEGGYGAVRCNGDWFDLLSPIVFHALIAGPLLVVAYFCFRRRYRKLFLVLGAVGAIILFTVLASLPEQLGLHKYFRDNLGDIEKMHARPWIDFLFLPFSLLSVFGPIIVAAWFYRFCYRLAYRRSDVGEKDGRRSPKTQATRWLVCLGLLCVMLPSVGMLLTFNSIANSPRATPSLKSVDHWFSWFVASCTLGLFLVFLGLVRRRPIGEPSEKATLRGGQGGIDENA